MKVGIGKHNSDKDINLSTRGTIEALTVEVVDGSGNQITSFVPTGFILSSYDYVSLVVSGVTKTYTLKTGGSGGATVNTIVVVYTDTNYTEISTVTKT